MDKNQLRVTKGSIFIYRMFDIAHEIDLKKAQPLLDKKTEGTETTLKRFKLQRDPHRTIIMRDPPLLFTSPEEDLSVTLADNNAFKLKNSLQIKLWDYGVLSICFKLELPSSLNWLDLIKIGSFLDNNAAIDEAAIKRRDQIVQLILPALKQPYAHSTYEDYLTYVIEDVTLGDTNFPSAVDPTGINNKLTDPLVLVKTAPVAELIFFEPEVQLSETTKKSLESTILQYSRQDLLMFDWNSALILDFTGKNDYQDSADLLEFSLSQLLELRVYDQLLDEKLDILYTSMEDKINVQEPNFYTELAGEASQLYIEFSDFFDKIDNSLKTVGDIHLAKVLKAADKKFGFDEFKRTMFRKMDTLANISKLLQDRIDSEIQKSNAKISHRQEFIIILLIFLECIPLFYEWTPKIIEFFNGK